MPTTRLNATEARRAFAETLTRVIGGERIVLQRRGRDLVAWIPMEDCAWLEELEDLLDVATARNALAAGGRPIAYAKLRRKLGLAAIELPARRRSKPPSRRGRPRRSD